jgi:two-component system LytT family response regulator
MIKAIIVDDEQHCINRLQSLLAEYCGDMVELKGSFQSVEDGIKAVKRIQPELVFLDVELKEQTGFDFLKELSDFDFEVIFTTAHDKYAVKAFKLSAIDYLLKPIDEDDLLKAIHKLKNKFSKADVSQKLDALFYNLKTVKSAAMKICVPVTTGLVFLKVDEIIRCESNINYTTIFTNDKQKLLVAKTLKEFEELLSGYGFFRIHNSHLINLKYIKSYKKGKGGSVIMEDGSEIEVSTRRKEEFLKEIASL